MGKQALPPFDLQVLTSEYLIEGTVAGDTNLYFPRPGEVVAPILLTSAQIQLTRSPEAVKRTCVHYFLSLNNALLFIPRTDFTQFTRYSLWKQYKNPLIGGFHLGPYWMTGRLMVMSPNALQGELPIYDLRIESLALGTHFGKLAAPFALVNALSLQGWESN
jgi:hypothetical protein